MKFDLIRGANDSAQIEQFEFFVSIFELTPQELRIQFEFTNPLSISIGRSPDIMRTTIIDSDIFISEETGNTVAEGIVDESKLPR